MVKIAWAALLSAALIYLCVVALVAFFQRRLIYFPSHSDAQGKGTARFRPLRGDDGIFLGYFRETPSAKEVLLFFHGNAGEAIDREWVAELAGEHLIVVLAEYPGYGAAPGAPSEPAILAAALRTYDTAAARWKFPIVIAGESLGSGAAVALAAERPAARLVLLSPFSALVDAARWHYPALPAGLLVRDRFLSREKASTIGAPVHIIHGAADEVIPIEQSRLLLARFPTDRKTLTELPTLGHNDLAYGALTDPAAEPFRRFLRGQGPR